MVRRATLALFAALVAVAALVGAAPRNALAQPAMDFLIEQLRQREVDRRRQLQRQQQLQDQQARQRREALERQRRAAAAAQQARRAEVSDASPRVTEVPKAPDARTLLVIGDDVADGLAQGLREAFAADPMVIVRAVTRPQSGLMRREPVDWVALARETMAAQPPLAVVVMFGLADRDPFPDGTGNADMRSERWRELYVPRVDALIAALNQAQVPVFWTGLPAMRQPSIAAEVAFLNDIYKSRTFTAGTRFVDVWEGFVDEEGRYVAVGPDVNGQTRRLRRPDGIGLTPAGNRKLAFYVETEIRRDIAVQAPALAALPPPDAVRAPEPSVPAAPAAPAGPYVGPVMQLTPAVALRGAELGGAIRPATADDIGTRVLVRGEVLPSQAGRADDFRWPQPEPGTTTPQPASAAGPRAEASPPPSR